MPAASLGDLLQVDSEKLLLKMSKPHGSSIRKRMVKPGSGGNYDYPTRLHLLYIGMDPNAQLTVRHLSIDNVDISTVDAQEAVLFQEARAHVTSGTAAPHLKSRDFEPIVFPAPAFFTIVIDEQGWEFYYPAPMKPDEVIANETHDPVVFIGTKTVILASSANGSSVTTQAQNFAENFAFYDAKKVTVATRDAVRMINYFTDEQGDLLKQYVDYGFQIYFRVPSAGSLHLTTVIIDPDGQNQGPRT